MSHQLAAGRALGAMRNSLLTAVLLTLSAPIVGHTSDEALQCNLVVGELAVWNGWPPHIRIEGADGVVYGVPESDDGQWLVPEDLITLLQKANGPLSGSFTLCVLGGTTSVPYDERPILMVSILDYDVDSK